MTAWKILAIDVRSGRRRQNDTEAGDGQSQQHLAGRAVHDQARQRRLVSTEAVLRDQVEDLRARLDRETEANRENRRIIAGLIERVPELESGVSEPRDPSVPAQEEESGATPQETSPGPQAPASRPWWRRWFGT